MPDCFAELIDDEEDVARRCSLSSVLEVSCHHIDDFATSSGLAAQL